MTYIIRVRPTGRVLLYQGVKFVLEFQDWTEFIACASAVEVIDNDVWKVRH